VKLVQIYECLCDETRLRILHLLTHSPLCVCHFQAVLREPQVKISKHLLYLKKHDLVMSRQHRNWRIYALPEKPSLELELQLRCLQDFVQENRQFRTDLERLKAIAPEASNIIAACGHRAQAKPTRCCS
jgi:ArsR family transcriptional regulator, arsenate/arsenite/antimonite-responsive transcriptional repressor